MKKFALYGVLVILFFFILYETHYRKFYKSESIRFSEIKQIKPLSLDIIERDKGAWKRNPFTYKKSSLKEKTDSNIPLDINIEAIVTGDKKYALINGKIFKIGDMIGNSRIVDIQRHKVILLINKIKKEIYIF